MLTTKKYCYYEINWKLCRSDSLSRPYAKLITGIVGQRHKERRNRSINRQISIIYSLDI